MGLIFNFFNGLPLTEPSAAQEFSSIGPLIDSLSGSQLLSNVTIKGHNGSQPFSFTEDDAFTASVFLEKLFSPNNFSEISAVYEGYSTINYVRKHVWRVTGRDVFTMYGEKPRRVSANATVLYSTPLRKQY